MLKLTTFMPTYDLPMTEISTSEELGKNQVYALIQRTTKIQCSAITHDL